MIIVLLNLNFPNLLMLTSFRIELSRNPHFPWTTQGFQSACIETQFLQRAELKIFKVTIYVVCHTPQKERMSLFMPANYLCVCSTYGPQLANGAEMLATW